MAHVSDSKKAVVAEITDMMNKAPIVGIVNMVNLPAPQLQNMRGQLRDKVDLRMAKKRLIKIAIDNIKDKDGLVELKDKLSGMPAILTTTENPFKLSKILKKNKSKAPIKGGQVAPNDIVVPAGKTNFAPGPIISELAGFGIKTKIDAGKIAIPNDCVVAKEGEVVSGALAALLTRLEIKPMEVGLDLVAVYENGVIYDKSILNVDEDQFLADLALAYTSGLNLAIEVGYLCDDTVNTLLSKAGTEAYNLAMEAKIMNKETSEDLIAKANGEAASVKNTANL